LLPRALQTLLVFCLALIFAGPHAFAQNAANLPTQIVLNDKLGSYDVTPFVYHTRDAARELSAREVFLRHQSNLRGERRTAGPINLSLDPVPHWILFDIVNDSHRSDWVLDFGTLAQGRTGMAAHLIVQNGQRSQTIIPVGRFAESRYALSLLPGQSMTLVMYVIPSDHAPFVLTPRIVEASMLLQETDPVSDRALKTVTFLMIAGAFMFFAGGLFLRRGVSFFPFVLFLGTQGIWLWLSGQHIYAFLPGQTDFQGIAIAVSAFFALAATQSLVISQEGEAGDSILLYICASFVFLAVILFAFVAPEGSVLRVGIVGVCAALGYGVAALKALMVKRELKWAGLAVALAWLTMLFGTALPYSVLLTKTVDPVFMAAPWLAVPLVCVLLVLAGSAYIRAGNTWLVREVLRQAHRAQTQNRLKMSKETADQARLLRVIEREREIMQDLRAREAERTEEMRMAKISADEANRAKSAFLAIVSHEIRTPMTGIMGMIRLMLDTQLSREQRDFAQTIQDSGDAMLALLNDILDFSKIEGGGMDLESIDFDLHRIIQSVAMLMNGHAAHKGIYLQTDIDIDAPRYLKGDPTRLRQVLLNLVGNAIKFTPRGGVTLRLKAGDLALATGERENHLPFTCSVEDTGIGISEEAQQNLFNPFSQADSSIARKFGGTGLGLAICKRLIEAMGSDIQLSSVESQGTTFFFTLLLPPGDQQAAQDDGRGVEGAGGTNIAEPMDLLVVDDNAINRKVMEGLLGRDGHRITSVASGQEALTTIAEKSFDLVFMDIEMPEMNGVETMGHIKTSSDLRVANTPVVALTGNVGDEDRAAYLAAGMRDAIAKPIDPERLRQVLLAFGKPKASTVVTGKTQPKAPVTFELSAEDLDEDSFSGSVEYTHTAIQHEDPADTAPTPHTDDAAEQPDTQVQIASVPQASGNPLLDDAIFGSLKNSLDSAQLNEMLAGVFAHNRAVLPNLQAAFNEEDTETLRGAAHELKGMNGNFGLKAVATAAGAIEKGCRSGELTYDQMEELVFTTLPDAIAKTEQLFLG
jgi:signal transduction histidine kinase/CheY-like chemotaxis protein/HPt (histidine-containing phosphotransfer) domain-containing protein